MFDQIIIETFVFLLPMAIGNSAPVLMYKLLGFNWLFWPLDRGKLLFGRPIFGKNKTFGGLLAAVLGGLLVGLLYMYLNVDYVWLGRNYLLFGGLAGFGAILGDLIKSFIKRRLGFPDGSAFLLMDQLDFVIGGSLLLYLFGIDPGWLVVLIGLIITPPIHFLVNVLAYLLKLKKVWW